jgi:hypothetical protein
LSLELAANRALLSGPTNKQKTQRKTMKKHIQNRPGFSSAACPRSAAGKKFFAAALLFALGISLVLAGNVTLRVIDAAGTSSFTGSTNLN